VTVPTINIVGLTAAISAVNAAITTVGTLETASPVVLNTVYQAVQNARAPFDSALAALDSSIDMVNIGSVAAGVLGHVSAPLLLAQQQAVEQEAIILVAEAYLVRVGANVFNSPG
jgi:hypothetical protein